MLFYFLAFLALNSVSNVSIHGPSVPGSSSKANFSFRQVICQDVVCESSDDLLGILSHETKDIDGASYPPHWFPIEDEPNVNGDIEALHEKAAEVRHRMVDLILAGIHNRSEEVHIVLNIGEDDDLDSLIRLNRNFFDQKENLAKACELVQKSEKHVAELTKAIEACSWKLTRAMIPTYDQLLATINDLNANKTVDVTELIQKISTSLDESAIHDSNDAFVNCMFEEVADIKKDLSAVLKEINEMVPRHLSDKVSGSDNDDDDVKCE